MIFSDITNQKKYESLGFSSRSCRLFSSRKRICYLLVIMAFVFFYCLFSHNSLHKYRNKLFKWQELSNIKTAQSGCLTQSILEERALLDLYEFISYSNRQEKALNYFMCFSTLFFTAKVQIYNPYRSVYNTSDFERRDRFYKQNNERKCIEAEIICDRLKYILNWNSLEEAYRSDIHLCILNEDKLNVCELMAKEYNSQRTASQQLKCHYNLWNGEYEFRFGDHISLIVHEYETAVRSSVQLSYWKLQSWWVAEAHGKQGLTDEMASMNVGLMGYLAGSEFFQVPLYYFYNQENRRDQKFNYLNYLSSPIRLPADIIEYFIAFYSDLWYV